MTYGCVCVHAHVICAVQLFLGARSAAFSSLRRLRVRLRCQHRAGATSALAARELAVVSVLAALVPLEFPLARALAALVHFRGVLDRPRIEASRSRSRVCA